MYKIKVDKGILLELELTGNLATITAEVLSSFIVVYQKLKKTDSFAAKQFKEDVEATIKSGFIFNELSEMLGKDGDEE